MSYNETNKHPQSALDAHPSTDANLHSSATEAPDLHSGKTDVHPSAVGSNTIPSNKASQPHSTSPNSQESTGANGDSGEGANPQLDAEGYPEQKHSGKVGYGPNYHQGAVRRITTSQICYIS